MSEIVKSVRQATFWLRKKTGCLRNRCAHVLLPYERVRKIAVLVHCGEKQRTAEATQLVHRLEGEGKQVFPILHGRRDDKHRLPPILRRRGSYLWEKESRRNAMSQEYDILIDATQTDEIALRYALHRLRAKSKVGVQHATGESIHDVNLVGRRDNPLAGIQKYLPLMG